MRCPTVVHIVFSCSVVLTLLPLSLALLMSVPSNQRLRTARIPTRNVMVQFGVMRFPPFFELKSSRSLDQPKEEPMISSNFSASFPSGCTVTLVDPQTNCQVILLGCFHGSQSSSLDVIRCLSQPFDREDNKGVERSTPARTVVALELCPTRFADLRRDVLRELEEETKKTSLRSSSVSSTPWIVRLINMVQKTSAQRGWPTGVVAALLGGMSGIQTALGGLEPGLEFRTALLHSMDGALSSASDSDSPPDIYSIALVDQNVDETLEQIGKVPSLALEMWKDTLKHGFSWEETFGEEANALARAVGLGIENDVDKVSVWGFVTRSSESVGDIFRLLLPPILGVQGFALVTNFGFESIQQNWMDEPLALAPTASVSTTSPEQMLSSMVPSLPDVLGHVGSFLVLTLGYVSFVLPAVRVILRERDDVLAKGIQSACRLATQADDEKRSCETKGSVARVVAVLGLLHVNGVAQRLLQQHCSLPTAAVGVEAPTTLFPATNESIQTD